MAAAYALAEGRHVLPRTKLALLPRVQVSLDPKMQLASRLRNTTLGDLLAELHRASASGVLELIEPHARHAIHLRRGFVQAVESNGGTPRLGDVAARHGVGRPLVERARMLAHTRGIRIGQALVATQAIRPADLDTLLAMQQRERLDRLFRLPDAEVRFRVSRPLPSGASEQTPLSPRDVFFGRPRKHGRMGPPPRRQGSPPPASSPRVTEHPQRAAALALLSLTPTSTPTEMRTAFRARVLALHPDRAPDATDAERSRRADQLIAVLDAYRTLTR